MLRPGCSTSSTAGSITSWSTRRRIPVPSNGRSWANWPKNFSQGSACVKTGRRERCSPSATKNNRSSASRAPIRASSVASALFSKPKWKARTSHSRICVPRCRGAAPGPSWNSSTPCSPRPRARDGISSTDDAIHHDAHRSETGRVEIWPTVEAPETEEADPWDQPVDAPSRSSAQTLLASRIATRIAKWLDGRATIPGTDQPITPGDIMILVRRRNAFAEEMIRQLLKARAGRGRGPHGADGADRDRRSRGLGALRASAGRRFESRRAAEISPRRILGGRSLRSGAASRRIIARGDDAPCRVSASHFRTRSRFPRGNSPPSGFSAAVRVLRPRARQGLAQTLDRAVGLGSRRCHRRIPGACAGA